VAHLAAVVLAWLQIAVETRQVEVVLALLEEEHLEAFVLVVVVEEHLGPYELAAVAAFVVVVALLQTVVGRHLEGVVVVEVEHQEPFALAAAVEVVVPREPSGPVAVEEVEHQEQNADLEVVVVQIVGCQVEGQTVVGLVVVGSL